MYFLKTDNDRWVIQLPAILGFLHKPLQLAKATFLKRYLFVSLVACNPCATYRCRVRAGLPCESGSVASGGGAAQTPCRIQCRCMGGCLCASSCGFAADLGTGRSYHIRCNCTV